jgi:hypothetical protein
MVSVVEKLGYSAQRLCSSEQQQRYERLGREVQQSGRIGSDRIGSAQFDVVANERVRACVPACVRACDRQPSCSRRDARFPEDDPRTDLAMSHIHRVLSIDVEACA